MEWIRDFISIYNVEIILGLAAGIVVLLIVSIIQEVKINKTKEKYNTFVRGMNGIDIEGLFIQTNRDINDIKRDINLFEQNINNIETKLAFSIQKIGFLRYNAFDDMGSELSYSIAILDNFQNGFILTSIFGRENSVSYAKPIKNGNSSIPLSAEELIAIDRAIKGERLEKSY